MRSEYFSSKEPGALFFPGGPPEYSHSEFSSKEPVSSQRTSLPDNFRPNIHAQEIKALQRENESVRILAAKVEADFALMLEEEDELRAEAEEVKKIEQLLYTREHLLRLLDSDLVVKQSELEIAKQKMEYQMKKLQAEQTAQTTLEARLEDSRIKGENKFLELLSRRKALQVSNKCVAGQKKHRVDQKLDTLVRNASTDKTNKAFEELDLPSDYLDVECCSLSRSFLEMLRIRRQIAKQRQVNAEVFARVRLLAPE